MYTSFTKASTRTLMIEKAIALFKENGTEHVSVKDICDEARVSRNAFYYHFESKDLLFDAIGDYVSMVSKKRIATLYGCKSYFRQFWEFYKAYLLTEIEMGSDIMNHICISRTMKGRADYFSYIDDELSAKMIKLAELAQADMGKEMVRRNFDALAVIAGGGAPFAQILADRAQIVADLRGAGLVRAVFESFQEMTARFMLAAQGCHAHAQ